MKSQMLGKTSPGERILLPKIKIQLNVSSKLSFDLKDAIADPILQMDKESIEHYELLVELAKADRLHRQFNRFNAYRK